MAVHYLGIRHHGPGSSRQLVKALDELRPTSILIEGASDLSDLIPLLAHPQMRPPVALLSYPKDKPETARFWPFAEFSPEYQAIRWAVAHQTPVRFIDLPSSWEPPEEETIVSPDQAPNESEEPSAKELENTLTEQIQDPIGELAKAAGYSDGESWWNEIIEENPEPGPVFEAIANAMEALREGEAPLCPKEAAREAHMRLEINKEQKKADGDIAVVCGAYHVPALRQKHTLKDDRAAIKSSKKSKMLATWAPWTSPRLTTLSGYGAGVTAPNWYSHLWETEKLEIWLGSDERGGDCTVEDIKPLVLDNPFPKLKALAFKNSEIITDIAKLLVEAPLLSQLEELDLSLGTLTDEGGLALLECSAVKNLKKLRLNHHYMSNEVMNRFSTLGIDVDVSDQEEPDDWDGEDHYYVAVSE